jgi:LPS O-antigen subunit length determinant protein (WzzB/FepE family)
VSVGGGDSVEAIAILGSRKFSAEFIEDRNLLPVFFADAWDSASNDWLPEVEADRPDIRDAVRYFVDNVRSITEDRDSGLVTLAVEWTDPRLAEDWANALVQRLNDSMRQRALSEAEANVTYLQLELGKTSVVTLQQSIGRLMESELQKLMLARGNSEFAFRVVDPAQEPKVRSRPRRSLIVVLSTFVGGLIAVLLVMIRHKSR